MSSCKRASGHRRGLRQAPVRLLYLCPGDIRKGRVVSIAWMRMCHAFAERGLDVTLLAVRRRESEDRPVEAVWAHYGIPESFRIRILPSPLGRTAPVLWVRVWAGLGGLAVAAGVCMEQAVRPREAIVYSRSPILLTPFAFLQRTLPRRRRARLVYETHEPPNRWGTWVARRVDLVVVNSMKLERDLSHGLGVAPQKVLYAPNPPYNDVRPRPKDQARAALGLPAEAVIACYCGKMRKDENEFFLRATAELSPALPRFRLLLVGGTPEMSAWTRARAEELGIEDSIIQTGHVAPSRVDLYQAAADTLIFHGTSSVAYFEHWLPSKGFEYQASGRPIVATDMPLYAELFGADGERAIRVEERTPAGLARGIQAALALDDGGRAMTERAARWIATRTWSGRADTVLRALGLG